MAQEFDLLGDPIPDGWGKRGRPPHMPTEKSRNKVMLLQAMGWPPLRMANALGISATTLRKHYPRELKARDEARDRADAARFMMLWGQAQVGNVGAMKELGKIFDGLDLARRAKAYEEDEDETGRPESMGKKEAAREAAKTAGVGSEWGTDLMAGFDGRKQ